jgi:hypothetical protein
MSLKMIATLTISTMLLSGCVERKMSYEYDEFTKQTVCKLKDYIFCNEFGGTSSRVSYLTLEKQSDKRIKAVLVSEVLGGLFGSQYAAFSDKPIVKFRLINKNQSSEELTFQAEALDTTYGTREHTGMNGRTFSTPKKSSAIVFYLTQEQLELITKASSGEFTAGAGKSLLEVTISEKDQRAFAIFIRDCCGKK